MFVLVIGVLPLRLDAADEKLLLTPLAPKLHMVINGKECSVGTSVRERLQRLVTLENRAGGEISLVLVARRGLTRAKLREWREVYAEVVAELDAVLESIG